VPEEQSDPIESVEDPIPQKTEEQSVIWKPEGTKNSFRLLMRKDPRLELGRLLLFTHGIDLARDIARNTGVTAYVDWSSNTVKLASQDRDLITLAEDRFKKLEYFYVDSSKQSI